MQNQQNLKISTLSPQSDRPAACASAANHWPVASSESLWPPGLVLPGGTMRLLWPTPVLVECINYICTQHMWLISFWYHITNNPFPSPKYWTPPRKPCSTEFPLMLALCYLAMHTDWNDQVDDDQRTKVSVHKKNTTPTTKTLIQHDPTHWNKSTPWKYNYLTPDMYTHTISFSMGISAKKSLCSLKWPLPRHGLTVSTHSSCSQLRDGKILITKQGLE